MPKIVKSKEFVIYIILALLLVAIGGLVFKRYSEMVTLSPRVEKLSPVDVEGDWEGGMEGFTMHLGYNVDLEVLSKTSKITLNSDGSGEAIGVPIFNDGLEFYSGPLTWDISLFDTVRITYEERGFEEPYTVLSSEKGGIYIFKEIDVVYDLGEVLMEKKQALPTEVDSRR